MPRSLVGGDLAGPDMAQPYMKKDDDEEEGDPPLLPPPPHKPYRRASRCLRPGTIREPLAALACRIWRDLASCLPAQSVVASSGVRIVTTLCWSGRGDRSQDLAGNWDREGSELPGSGVPPFAVSRHLGASDRAGRSASRRCFRIPLARGRCSNPFTGTIFFSALELHVQYFRLDP